MKNPMIIIILFLFSFVTVQSQDIYISSSTNKIYRMGADLNLEFILDVGYDYGIIYDIASKDENILMAITGSSVVLKIDLVNGISEWVNTLDPGTFTSLYYHPNNELLTINNVTGKLYTLDGDTGVALDSTDFQQYTPGDITYYKGEMIFPGADLNLYTYVPGSDPYSVACTDISVFGFSNFITSCDENLIYCFDGDANVYEYQPENDLIILLGNLFAETQNLFGSTTTNESNAALCPKESLPFVNCDISDSESIFLEKFSIYPNPFDSELTLQFSSPIDHYTMAIMDILGKKVYEGRMAPSLNLEYLETGIYILSVMDEQGTVLSNHKIVKR